MCNVLPNMGPELELMSTREISVLRTDEKFARLLSKYGMS